MPMRRAADIAESVLLTGGCQCGAIRFAVTAAPAKISVCHCRMCQKASGAPFASFADIEHADFAWTRGQPGRVQILINRRAGFLRRLRHAPELPPHRRPPNRDHDRHLRPPRPAGSDPAIWNRIPARLGGRHRQSAEPDDPCRITVRKSSAVSSATSIRITIRAGDHRPPNVLEWVP